MHFNKNLNFHYAVYKQMKNTFLVEYALLPLISIRNNGVILFEVLLWEINIVVIQRENDLC